MAGSGASSSSLAKDLAIQYQSKSRSARSVTSGSLAGSAFIENQNLDLEVDLDWAPAVGDWVGSTPFK